MTFPKIELHVHLEGTVRAGTLLQIARLGVSAQDCYQAGLGGALCDQRTRQQLQQIGEAFEWAGHTAGQP